MDTGSASAQEKSLSVTVKDLIMAVNNLEEKVYGPRVEKEAASQTPSPLSIVRQNMIVLEELTKRIRKVADQLPL